MAKLGSGSDATASGMNMLLKHGHMCAMQHARRTITFRLGHVCGNCVEKCSEVPANGPRSKLTYRVVFQSNNVIDQAWEWAMFQDLGASPASMYVGNIVD